MQSSIREALAADAERIAQLCLQLGYQVPRNHVDHMLHVSRSHAQIFVAVVARVGVVGFARAVVNEMLLGEPAVEIEAMLVDSEYRGEGIGTALLHAIEQWSGHRGVYGLRLSVDVSDDRAHEFFLRNGYELLRNKLVLSKPL